MQRLTKPFINICVADFSGGMEISMNNEEYILYLNSLHNYNAQNQNAYGEKNVISPFFNDVVVKVGLCDFIVEQLNCSNPHIIILTGHAGDGKTSIMYQVLKDLGIGFDTNEEIIDVHLPNKKVCRCIKDFSELTDEKKLEVLEEIVDFPGQNKFVFMVANTGPLINTYGELFDSAEEKEKARIALIAAMDENTASINNIMDHKISVINVATVDNTYFASEFLNNLIQEKLWVGCDSCKKKVYCHIIRNRNIVIENIQRVTDFINMHYIWLTEHGKRLTIRSMTEQLAYMLTGGENCQEIAEKEGYKYLFSNLFFGYIGTKSNAKASNIIAVREASNCNYDLKRLRSDEQLLVNHDYDFLFGKNVADILKEAEKKNAYVEGWTEYLRRTYMFLNIITDEKIKANDSEDIFSKQFLRYLELRNGESIPSKSDARLIIDALSMIYIGTTKSEKEIPLSLSRESGITQNVQLITGTIPTRRLSIVQEKTKYRLFNKNKSRNVLKLKIDSQVLDCELSLPLLDYFEELKNGAIATNVDPQLTHGVESLKAQLSKVMDDEDDNTIEMIILKNNGNKTIRLELTDSKMIRCI